MIDTDNVVLELQNSLAEVARPAGRFGGRAKFRADLRTLHHAVEIGLKAVLRLGGVSEPDSRGHDLHELLGKVRQYNRSAFDALERCVDSITALLDESTGVTGPAGIFAHYAERSEEAYQANRYWSIEGRNGLGRGRMATDVEVIQALVAILNGQQPKDIYTRIEEEAAAAIRVSRRLEPHWDCEEWLAQGAIRPRLENLENLARNKALRRALRILARDSSDGSIGFWAYRIRTDRRLELRDARTARRRR